MRVSTGTNVLDEWLGDIKDIQSNTYPLFPFFLRVGCVKMAAPRHERFEFMIDMGQCNIDRIFNDTPFTSDHLTFMFPERWMGVHEQRGMMSKLCKHSNINMIKSVDIMTSSPILLGEFHREQIRILTWDDDQKHNGN